MTRSYRIARGAGFEWSLSLGFEPARLAVHPAAGDSLEGCLLGFPFEHQSCICCPGTILGSINADTPPASLRTIRRLQRGLRPLSVPCAMHNRFFPLECRPRAAAMAADLLGINREWISRLGALSCLRSEIASPVESSRLISPVLSAAVWPRNLSQGAVSPAASALITRLKNGCGRSIVSQRSRLERCRS